LLGGFTKQSSGNIDFLKHRIQFRGADGGTTNETQVIATRPATWSGYYPPWLGGGCLEDCGDRPGAWPELAAADFGWEPGQPTGDP